MPRHFRQPLVGRRLRAIREQLGLTRAELSKFTRVKPSAIYRLEKGADVRLSTYFPIVEWLIARDPQVWALAEQLLADPEERAETDEGDDDA